MNSMQTVLTMDTDNIEASVIKLKRKINMQGWKKCYTKKIRSGEEYIFKRRQTKAAGTTGEKCS